MPTRFELPQLSSQDYATLFEAMQASIPVYSDTWTDYNDSDPGITLLQLIAWVGDVNLYRIDGLPRELYLNFARLIVGAAYDGVGELIDTLKRNTLVDKNKQPIYLGDDPIVFDPARLALAELVNKAQQDDSISSDMLRQGCIRYLTTPYRGVTGDDMEALALQVTSDLDPASSATLAIAHTNAQPLSDRTRLVLTVYWTPECKPTYLTDQTQLPANALGRLTGMLEYGSLAYAITQMADLLFAVNEYMLPRVLVGSVVDICGATRLPLAITGNVPVIAGVDVSQVLADIYAALTNWFDPVTGGPDGQGWPVGQRVADHDLAQPLNAIEGIDRSQPLMLSARDFAATTLGQSRLGATTPVGVNPDIGAPMLAYLDVLAMTTTWTLDVGVHSRVGLDTRLPMASGG